jgi:predicted Zn-dependent peptidase
LYQVIYNVDVENDEFDKIVFEREKQFIENKIKERKDDKLRYAVERTEELICDNSPFGLNVFGKEEDVKGVTSKQVYNEYLNLINNSYKNFIVSGNLKSYENIEEEIKNKFKEKLDSKKTYHDLQIDIKNQEDIINRNEIKEISEKQETSQSVITFGMSVDDYLEEDVYALNVYNAILGGTPSSKLFQIFRERESLAYTVRSRYYKFKKIFVIYAGIQKENYNRAKEVVFELLEGIVKGDISQEELNSAKDSIIADLLECEDSKIALAKMLNSNLLYYKNNEITIDIMISKIQQIQIQDVVNVSKKIKVKKIYLLGGETDV